jgi:hypothetical protein
MGGVTALVAVGGAAGALARLDQEVVGVAMRAYSDPGMALPTGDAFAAQVADVHRAAKEDMAGADQEAIRDFLRLVAQRRGLPEPHPVGLDFDAAVMGEWPADLFAKASKLVWERFAEMRVPNPPDFRVFIEDDLAERHRRLAALHTLEKRLETVARRGHQIPADSFGGGSGGA